MLKTKPHEVSILSPLNQPYNKTSISVVFTVDKPFNQAYYNLDSEESATITGNFTLTALSNGLHNITVHAANAYGNMGASETIRLTIIVPNSFSNLAIATTTVSALALSAVLIVYLLKRKRKPP